MHCWYNIATPGGAHDLSCLVDTGLPATKPEIFQALRHIRAGEVVKDNQCIREREFCDHGRIKERIRRFVAAIDEYKVPTPALPC